MSHTGATDAGLLAKIKAVEVKVWASSAATFIVSAALALLNAIQDNHALLGSLPTWAQSLLLAVVPTLIVFATGYLARHTPRAGDAAP